MVSRQMSRLAGLVSPLACSSRCLPKCSKLARLTFQPNLQRLQISSKLLHTTNIRPMSSVIIIQDEDDFKSRVLGSQTPVIVDFHADWCGPCKLLGPRLETLIGGQNNEGSKIVLAKVDIDEMPDVAMEYGVEAIPTVISVLNGKVVDKFVGLKEDDEIDNFIGKLVDKLKTL